MDDNVNLIHHFYIICPFSMTDCTGGFVADPNSKYYVPDGSIQASSEHSLIEKASYGRLHGSSCWMPAATDAQPWIDADLGRPVNVYGIQTQGGCYAWWVTSLKVSTSQQVPGAGRDVGDFIKEGNEIKVHVCNVPKKTEMS